MQYLTRMGKVMILLLGVFLQHESRAQYPAGSPVAVNGKLKVIGRYLRNECGNPVQLRGMATHGVQWFGNCVNASSIEALTKDWNVDVLRISMYIQEGGYVNNPTYWKGWIDNVVDECAKRGIYAIIDFHVHLPGDPVSYLPEAREFWTYMSTKHKGKKHVIYEICNEPSGVTWSRVKEYANEIIPLIRAIDPSTVIVVGSSTWSQDVNLVADDRLNYPNLIYSLHFYTQGEPLRTKASTAFAKGLPIFVTEFGTSNAQNTAGPFIDEMEVWNAWMEDRKVSWANWSFSDKGEPSAALIPGSCGGNWNATSASGTWVKSKILSPADNFVCNGDTQYVKNPSTPYSGVAATIPGKIQAEDFDKGGNGIGFRNFGKPSGTYRTDGIEIFKAIDTASVMVLGIFEVGEWANYTVNALSTGNFDFQLRVSCGELGKMLYMEIDGKNVAMISVPVTGSSFETITVPKVNVSAGIHDLRLFALHKGVRVDFLNVVPSPVGNSNRQPEVYLKTPPSSSAIYPALSTIPLTAFAYDIDGSIAKVEFYSGQSKLGEDLAAPYSYTWSNVAAGTYAITAVCYDNSGAKATSQAITVNVVPPSQIPQTGEGLRAEYFNNKNLTGSPVLTRIDTTVDFSWGAGSPAALININQFSVRWSGKIKPQYSETYTFYTNSDDGIRLYVNNVPIVMEWKNGTISSGGTISLVANSLYDIRLEYYDDCCDASAKLSWSSPSQAKQIIPKARLFLSTAINLPPLIQLVSPLNNTNYESPASILIQANATDPDGSVSKVEFYNGSTLIGTDTETPYSFTWTQSVPGSYAVSAKAFDNLGEQTTSSSASIKVVPTGDPLGTGLKAEYFNNKTLTGAPVITRTDANVDFLWAGSPTQGINVNQFSVRWSGEIEPLYSEEYTFYTTSDDGVLLYVNDQLLVSNWTNHASITNSGKIKLNAKQKYSIRLEYYDDCCSAEIRLAWSSLSQVKQPVPQSNLFPSNSTVIFPAIALLTPSNNASFTAPASIPITVNASDADGSVAKVEFFNGTTKIGESTTSPFSFIWSSVAVGSYTLSAKATDNEGNTTNSASIAISVSSVPVNQLPTVGISAPVTGATFTAPATVSITATASDADGTVSKVEFYNGTTKIGEDMTSPYAFSWTSVAAGTYVLSAKATDNMGGVGSSSNVTITVNTAVNQAPTVTITAPVTGASFSGPASISVTATASDADGTVSKVEFYNGTTKLGEDLTSPYAFTWVGVAEGSYTLSAKATDNSANVTTSTSVTVSVVPSSNGNCTTEALPVAANWVVRNQWSDQSNNSGVANDMDGLKVTHRAWGQDQLYLIQTGKKYSVSSSNNYVISFDFKNDATMAATTLEIGLAAGASGSGPVALQPLSSISAGAANGSFSTKSVTIKPVSSSEVSLTIGLKWPSQINKQFIGYIKNISVCTTSVSARVDEESVMMENMDAIGLAVKVAPNPSDRSFQLQLNGTRETVKLSVTSLTGALVHQSELFGSQEVQIGNEWPKGIYILKLSSANQTIVTKIEKY